MRKRSITNSPDQEFAARPGSVLPIDDTIAALITARKAIRKITRGAVRVTMPSEPAAREFGGGGALISHPSMEGKEVIVAYNPLVPHRVHIFDTKGKLLETIGQVSEATWFQSDEESKKAFADMRRAQKQHAAQLQALHQRTTVEELQRAETNLQETRRAVTTFAPQPETQDRKPETQYSTSTSRMASKAERALDTIRNHHKQDQESDADLAARAAAAIDGE